MRAGGRQALRVQGTIDMRRADQRVKAHMLYLASRPAKLRFETESFFDQPLSILVSDGMTFAAWDMKNGRFVRGAATPANISQILPVPMDGPEVSGILLGDPPWIPYAQAVLETEPDGDRLRLELTTARERQRVWLDPDLLYPIEVRLDRGEQLVYQLRFEDWLIESGRAVIARKIEFEMPAEQISVRIRIRQVQADPDLPAELFRLEPPEGAQVEVWQ
jgi:outer membrane lipoprotein-sorting protein